MVAEPRSTGFPRESGRAGAVGSEWESTHCNGSSPSGAKVAGPARRPEEDGTIRLRGVAGTHALFLASPSPEQKAVRTAGAGEPAGWPALRRSLCDGQGTVATQSCWVSRPLHLTYQRLAVSPWQLFL